VKPSSPQTLVATIKDLVTLPDIYFQLNEMMDDPRFTLADIGSVISKDPALTARLLRTVNSSFYGFESRIDTISRAIAIIGVQELYNLVVATCVVDSFRKISTDLVDMTLFWIRSVECAIVTRLLAKQCSILNAERMFLAGLLHDIGSLVMYQTIPELSSQVLVTIRQDRRLLPEAERQIVGFTHADVGRELLKSWKLPDSLYQVIGHYRQPDFAAEFRLDASLVYLASRLIDDKEYGRHFEETLLESPALPLEVKNLSISGIHSAMEQLPLEFLEIFEQLMPNRKLSPPHGISKPH